MGCLNIGATQVEGNFLMQCYSPQQGSIGYKPVACVYNGQTYMPGQQFRMQQYGGGSLDSFTLGVCMQDSQGIRIKPAGCIDDYGRKYFRTSNMQIRGQNAQCIIDTNTNQIAIQLSGTYGGGPYGGGNYGGGNYGGYNNGNYNNNNNQD
uniref:Abnormal cell migration protein 18-like fibronectin type I domain-containing protein n=1 Tax=Romanomermis culicivorax TaxID=13658 RepID=A0A915IAU9_ROMCU